MKRLYKGIREFQQSHFRKEEDFFKRLSKSQSPEVLFITCADSRIDPNLVTQSRPGELFIVRNVGNIVPPYDAIKDKNSVAAAIEFSVLSLKVSDIIICGHSGCGAMDALYASDEDLKDMPHLRDWLKIASPVRARVEAAGEEVGLDRQRATEEANVLTQLANIQSYPFVAEALNEGRVHLHGWYYEISTGHVYAFKPEQEQFEKIVYAKG
ncbi:MAG: hypothetical protein A2X56_00110 [Nitrospirae bacterium GWC2_57_13]|nr:MAG: hypothetical protein A2072_05045 [Nitrospirae bacterium GWC1_57_7]OGW28398.1 MAG: hypothetical protein A2X56_00110 [Nitrospirae bacterium GWC2_57_13]OGW45552.1 MAG: hypothetical protein A2X57_02585 [Nitrospirae bacterium GWD2_57_8]HAS54532.1 carbonic anhydrase [Nitrospiraceae bacterium]